jgi:ferrous iron transport protein A
MEQLLPLNRLPIGEKAKVRSLTTNGIERRRMLDLGLVQGTTVEALQKSPSGDPIAYFIRGAVIALRDEDARKILIEC